MNCIKESLQSIRFWAAKIHFKGMVLTCFLRRYLITSYSLLILHFSSLNTLSLEFGRLNIFYLLEYPKMEGVFFIFRPASDRVGDASWGFWAGAAKRERMRRGVRRIVVKGTTIRVIHLNFRNRIAHPYRIKKPDKSFKHWFQCHYTSSSIMTFV